MRRGDIENPFTIFGTSHLLALLAIAAVAVAIPATVRRWASIQATVARSLGCVMLVHEFGKIALLVILYDRPLVQQLPLHLCSVATLLGAWMLLRQSYAAFEVAYFWTFGGTLQALLTPDLALGYPSAAYWVFFTGHGLTILAVSYAIGVFGFVPTFRSLIRALSATAVYALMIGMLNVALGTNYLYLMQKPDRASLLDLLGPWPHYIVALVLIGILICGLLYLPFAIHRRIRSGASQ